ncbi:MAG: DEAD/DEAH box helicase [Clostridia bacterium]|nr:DEAD/DEAH box helicase [Clostridia bacterium]
MSNENDIFYRYSPFIRDFIYRHGWENLRSVQLEAAKVIFETENNLLITSSTASGKTEAAFFPILSMLEEDPSQSVAVLYIAPLKSLINDQFIRMDELLDESGIPVFHWHGDVSFSHKNKLLNDPKGILQITPESLESMLMNRSNDIVRLFSDLRFIIIDEIHTLTGTDRGNQIICQLSRISRLIARDVRRIGLSATVGDVEAAKKWLCGGSGRDCDAPKPEEGRVSWKLALEHFFIQNASADQTVAADGTPDPFTDKNVPVTKPSKAAQRSVIDAGYEYIYDCVKDKKALVFSNSREETEYITATLRQIAENRREPDIFLIHHGNLSASLREEAEAKLKSDEYGNLVTCATVTLELGIDIGRLQRIVQIESPHSVSSFLQRLGRSGRRGEPPEMFMIFREEDPLPDTPLPQLIPWELIRAIAIIQLYIEERFIEPPATKTLPFSLLFQQTLSVLASSGELSPKALADRILSMPPFAKVPKEHYKTLLISMLKEDYLEQTEEKTLIVGLKGERLTNSFKFYAVFKDTENYSVRCESDEIGTITTPPPVGERFALAGRVWEVTELDIGRKLIYVKPVKGKMEISWPGDYGEIHTKILQRMRKVLSEDTVYPYLKPNAAKRLAVARHIAKNTGMLDHSVVSLGGMTYCMFPWLGSRSFRTLRKTLVKNAAALNISNVEFEGCCFITFRYEGDDIKKLTNRLYNICKDGVDKESLISKSESPVFEKYDDYVPGELLRLAYAADRLRTDEMIPRTREMKQEEEEFQKNRSKS